VENKIREMTDKDIGQILKIENQEFPNPWSRGIFKQELRRKNAHYIVAEKKKHSFFRSSNITGYGGVWIICSREAHITNLAVDSKYQNQGIGSLLLEELIQLAREAKSAYITLEVRRSNCNARRLYEKYDFQRCGLRKGYYRKSGEDALIMTRTIKKGEIGRKC